MAISSRLALWEQKGSIREEDRGPPPSAPPLLFSVIPGGFIKQLVRETEKESKEARLKKAAKATFSFSWQPVVEDSPAQSRDTPAAKVAAGSVGKSLQNGLQASRQGGKEPPTHTALPPGTAAHSSDTSKAPTVVQSPRPEDPQAVKPQSPEKRKGEEKSPKAACPGGSPPSAAPATSKDPQQCGKVKEGDVPKRKGPEGTKKEKGSALSGQQPPNTVSNKKELGLGRKELEKMKKDVGGGKKEPKEMKEPAKSTNKSEGAKREAGGTREKPEGVAKGAGKAKGEPQKKEEAPAESKAAHMESKEETRESTEQEQCCAGVMQLSCPCGCGCRQSLWLGCSSSLQCCSLLQAPKDMWYEADKVWLVQQDGFMLATQLKPDVGTPELPVGRVRVRRDADGSITEVDEDSVQRTNPPHLDLAEDLATLLNLNECSALNTLQHRYRSHLPYTYAGPSLVAIRPGPTSGTHAGKVRGRDSTAPHICSVAQRAYRTLLAQRRDQAIVPMGRSGAGKTTSCQLALEHLVGMAGSVDGRVSVEKIQAMFTVLGAFGAVSTEQNSSSTRFSMILSLDFSAAGRITAAHLQTMLLERGRVAQQPPGESNFNVFPMMLAGLDVAQRTTLHLHQVAENNTFGIKPFSKPEEKQKASVAFTKLQAAMDVLGITAEEQVAVWRVLAGIHHLGAAGACRVGRKQFMHFEWATHAAEVLGCELEELSTAVFKHHLKQILEQAAARSGGRPSEEEGPSGQKMTGVECVEGMASGLYEELFAALVSMINRSFSSQHLSVASIAVVDTPGFHNPRHHGGQRAATFEELCHNYVHERLQGLFYERTFVMEMERYKEENVEVSFDLPEHSPLATLSIVDLNPSQVTGPGGGTWIAPLMALLLFAGAGYVRRCEQALHFEIPHQLGTDPVRYDLAGWVSKAKLNLSAENASQLLQQSQLNALQELAMPRRGVPRVCRAVAGLEGCSQAALQRNACIRKVFASSLAAVRRRSVCAQLKLQADALTSLLRRSQLHFVHSLVPGTTMEKADPQPLDVPALRAQLGGTQLLDALRLRRSGYPDHLLLTHFRRRFQVLAPAVMKKCTSAYEVPDESKAIEELFQALDLEKKSVAIGRSQVFLKAGVLFRLEKQRDKLITQKLILLQAACKGFLSRQKFKRLKVQRLAVRCIQKNVGVFQVVRHWPWWQLLGRVRPLLSVNLAEEQLRVKEKELVALRKKLERSEQSCSELRQNTEKLESKIIDLTMELSDERHKGDIACQVLDGERAERLRGTRELQELQSKHDQVQKKLESVQKELEEAQQLVQLREMKISGSEGEDVWHVRFDCAQTEIAFLQKRLAQLEERLSAELSSRTGLEQKLGEAQVACQTARAAAQQLRRRCRRLTCELEDTRVLAESQQSRNHELEKRQKKFDLQLAQALGESAFERSLREKVVQENSSLRWEMGKLQQNLEQQAEGASLAQWVSQLSGRVQELSAPGALDSSSVPVLRQKLWDLEASTAEQHKELERQTANVDHLEQLHQRLELEIERMKQIHQKELEDKDEELEDARQSCQRRLRQLEMQLEQEHEEKQTALREKQDLEGLVGTLCEQIGHRDLDVEKRLRRDLRRTRALLADAQLLLAAPTEPGATGTAELQRLQKQVDISPAKLGAILDSVLTLTLCPQADEQLNQMQHERDDLLRRVSEDQEDLNELMAKHKALIAQSATDIAQIQELQTQVEEVKKEKQSLQEKLLVAQASVARLEQRPAERAVISRQEARIRDLESQLDFQAVQMKRFEVLVLRLRDSIIKMGEELEKAAESEAREKESTKYYQRRMEEMKADMDELVQRELESSRRRVELVRESPRVRGFCCSQLHSAAHGIKAIAAAPGVHFSAAWLEVRGHLLWEHSPAPVLELLSATGHFGEGPVVPRGRREFSCSHHAATLSPSLLHEAGSSVTVIVPRSRTATRPGSSLSTRSVDAADMGKAVSPLLSARRREYGKPPSDSTELTSPMDKPRARSPLPSASAALSDYVGELRRRRVAEREPGPLLEDPSALPIYRTTGAAALRRSRSRLGDADTELPPEVSDGTDSSLPRSSSLRSLTQQPAEPTLSPVLKRSSKFGSCDSLLLSIGGPELLGMKPWRSRLEPSAEEDAPGSGLGEGPRGDPCAWKIPTLGFERKASPELEEFLPAIRKSRSTSSLAKPGRDRKDGHRTLTVRFQDEAVVGDSASSRSRSVAQPGLAPRGDRSDSSSSSGSILSSRSIDSIKQQPWRSDGEGCSGKGSAESSGESHRAEAEGKEDDVSSIMRKYLGKE
uniref:Myosin XVIIIB n=1 Tax=Coturnix japonica TaxID=93934 RepID=A0A8C2T7K5_COTJA